MLFEIKKITMFQQDAKATVRQWSIWQENNTIIIEYGVLNGKMQYKQEIINKGKAARTLQQQIESRINSRVQKQKLKGYKFSLEEARQTKSNALGLYKPMLAQPFSKVKIIDFSKAFIQPKYDGNRCLITKQHGRVFAYSRNGKEIAANIDHIFRGLDLNEGETIDGELYCHGESLQTIVSWIKRDQENTKRLKYHAYDIVKPLPYSERYGELAAKIKGESIVLTPTDRLQAAEEIIEFHKAYTDNNYEGAIVRWGDFYYEDGKRSKSLVKVKSFLDDTFTVIDVQPSKDGWGILVCRLNNGKLFRVSAPGTIDEKEHVYNYQEKYIGRVVRVEFMNYTKDGIPFHPVATNFID